MKTHNEYIGSKDLDSSLKYLFNKQMNGVLRNGLSWLFGLGMVTLVVLYFVKWPDSIDASIMISAESPPRVVVAPSSNRIEQLFVENGDDVKRGDLLVLLESVADYKEVVDLEEMISEISLLYKDSIEKALEVHFTYSKFSNLGEIQSDYEKFLHSGSVLRNLIEKGYYNRHRQILVNKRSILMRVAKEYEKQRIILQKDFDLAQSRLETETQLYGQGAVTKYEVENQKSVVLAKERSLINLSVQLEQNKRDLQLVEQSILGQEMEMDAQKLDFVRSFKNLKASVLGWNKTYTVLSPKAGEVSMSKLLVEGQSVVQSTPLMTVVPSSQEYVIVMEINQYRFGEIDTTKLVKIKLESFPFEEHGMLTGRINSISKIPNEGKFTLYASLVKEDGRLNVSEADLRTGLLGMGQIIVEDRSLLRKLFSR